MALQHSSGHVIIRPYLDMTSRHVVVGDIQHKDKDVTHLRYEQLVVAPMKDCEAVLYPCETWYRVPVVVVDDYDI